MAIEIRKSKPPGYGSFSQHKNSLAEPVTENIIIEKKKDINEQEMIHETNEVNIKELHHSAEKINKDEGHIEIGIQVEAIDNEKINHNGVLKNELNSEKMTEIINNAVKEAVTVAVKNGTCDCVRNSEKPKVPTTSKEVKLNKMTKKKIAQFQDKGNNQKAIKATNRTSLTSKQNHIQDGPLFPNPTLSKSPGITNAIRKCSQSSDKEKNKKKSHSPQPRLKNDNRCMTGNVNIYICSEANENARLNSQDNEKLMENSDSATETKSNGSSTSITTSRLIDALQKKQRKKFDNQSLDCLNEQPENTVNEEISSSIVPEISDSENILSTWSQKGDCLEGKNSNNMFSNGNFDGNYDRPCSLTDCPWLPLSHEGHQSLGNVDWFRNINDLRTERYLPTKNIDDSSICPCRFDKPKFLPPSESLKDDFRCYERVKICKNIGTSQFENQEIQFPERVAEKGNGDSNKNIIEQPVIKSSPQVSLKEQEIDVLSNSEVPKNDKILDPDSKTDEKNEPVLEKAKNVVPKIGGEKYKEINISSKGEAIQPPLEGQRTESLLSRSWKKAITIVRKSTGSNEEIKNNQIKINNGKGEKKVPENVANKKSNYKKKFEPRVKKNPIGPTFVIHKPMSKIEYLITKRRLASRGLSRQRRYQKPAKSSADPTKKIELKPINTEETKSTLHPEINSDKQIKSLPINIENTKSLQNPENNPDEDVKPSITNCSCPKSKKGNCHCFLKIKLKAEAYPQSKRPDELSNENEDTRENKSMKKERDSFVRPETKRKCSCTLESTKAMICVYCDNPCDQCTCRAPIRKCFNCGMPSDVCNCQLTSPWHQGHGVISPKQNNKQMFSVTAWKPRKDVRRYFSRDPRNIQGNLEDKCCWCFDKNKPYGSDKLPYQKLEIFSNVMNELEQKMTDSICCNKSYKTACCSKTTQAESSKSLCPIPEITNSQLEVPSSSFDDKCSKTKRNDSRYKTSDVSNSLLLHSRRDNRPQAKCFYCKTMPCRCRQQNEGHQFQSRNNRKEKRESYRPVEVYR